ncbi:hypothetical protein E2C01_074382 [Portunus trituberculatus]|uniref:Uncharacterized protein n=1 Tax=Portunus trituberculatus TaxID=210409 RepID=A0A5B7IH45_PORTR|nr:hypothetical protein [Portunus trituberculatus]
MSRFVCFVFHLTMAPAATTLDQFYKVECNAPPLFSDFDETVGKIRRTVSMNIAVEDSKKCNIPAVRKKLKTVKGGN